MKKEVLLLELARLRIQDGREKFICLAVLDAVSYMHGTRGACFKVLAHIQKSLGRCSRLETWLERVAGIHSSWLTPRRMKEYRLRYIDHLIKEFS